MTCDGRNVQMLIVIPIEEDKVSIRYSLLSGGSPKSDVMQRAKSKTTIFEKRPFCGHCVLDKNIFFWGGGGGMAPEIMPKMHFKAKSSVNFVSEQQYTHLGSSWKFFCILT